VEVKINVATAPDGGGNYQRLAWAGTVARNWQLPAPGDGPERSSA